MNSMGKRIIKKHKLLQPRLYEFTTRIKLQVYTSNVILFLESVDLPHFLQFPRNQRVYREKTPRSAERWKSTPCSSAVWSPGSSPDISQTVGEALPQGADKKKTSGCHNMQSNEI